MVLKPLKATKLQAHPLDLHKFIIVDLQMCFLNTFRVLNQEMTEIGRHSDCDRSRSRKRLQYSWKGA